jgi:hypothetical protein
MYSLGKGGGLNISLEIDATQQKENKHGKHVSRDDQGDNILGSQATQSELHVLSN